MMTSTIQDTTAVQTAVLEAKATPGGANTNAPPRGAQVIEEFADMNIKTDELTRQNIEALGESVRLVDTDEKTGLDLFCYTKCTLEDSKLLKACRGVVFDGDNIVMPAFPFTSEFNNSASEKFVPMLGEFDKCTFYDAHEGALIRMFFFGGRWFVCTHRKLDAFRSKWASRQSFGTLFKQSLEACFDSDDTPDLPDGDNILERFQTRLDRENQYMFLVRNSADNRIVCHAPGKPTLYHVGTFVNGELDMECDVGVPHSRSLTFADVDDLIDHIDCVDIKKLTGVLCFAADGSPIKIVNDEYQNLFNARGNEPSIKFRYLQVRLNRTHVNMLHYLYPNFEGEFEEYENAIYEIARGIYRSYVQRYIKKLHVVVPREEFQVMKACHVWHHQDRGKNMISLDQVIGVLNTQPPTALNHMIRRYRTEQTVRINPVNNKSPVILSVSTPTVEVPALRTSSSF
jgi:hypothetical protein